MGIQEKVKGIQFLQHGVNLQIKVQLFQATWVNTSGRQIVEQIAGILDVGGRVCGKGYSFDPRGQITPGKQPRAMRGKTGLFGVLEMCGIANVDFHGFSARRFIDTLIFMFCAPEPLNVPRTGVASTESRP